MTDWRTVCHQYRIATTFALPANVQIYFCFHVC